MNSCTSQVRRNNFGPNTIGAVSDRLKEPTANSKNWDTIKLGCNKRNAAERSETLCAGMMSRPHFPLRAIAWGHPNFDGVVYKRGNLSERMFNKLKTGGAHCPNTVLLRCQRTFRYR